MLWILFGLDELTIKYQVGNYEEIVWVELAILNTVTNSGFELELLGSLVRLANGHPTSTYTRDFERNSLSSL